MRRHRSLGLRVVPVEIGDDAIELLKKRGYEPRRDKLSIGLAITPLSQALGEAMRRREFISLIGGAV